MSDSQEDKFEDNGPSSTRLTCLLPSTGGGLQPKRRDGGDSKNSHQNGDDGKGKKTSLLGLDRLAAQNRKEEELKGGGEKKSQQQQFSKRHKPSSQRSYRRSHTETPSHPGGLNRDAYSRAQRQQEQGQQHRGQRQYKPYDRNSSRSSRHNDTRSSSRRSSLNNNDRYRQQYSDYGDDGYYRNRRDGSSSRNNRRDDNRDRDDYSRRRDSGRSSSRRRDCESSDRKRRNIDRYITRENEHDRKMMPPPPSSSTFVTPSTHASTSTMRRRDTVDAPTPMSGGIQSKRNRTPAPTKSVGWDIETPLHGPRMDGDDDTTNLPPVSGESLAQQNEDFDRHFYLDQEEGGYVQDNANTDDMGRFLFENSKTKAREQEMEQRRQQSARYNPRKSALQDDQDAWEENRLLSSGAAVRNSVDLDMTNEQDTRVTLLVHQVKPPFLDGRVSFSTIREAVPTVKDSSSDFAKMSREGSATLNHLRANKDKHTMRQKFWELGGTRMGDAVGVKNEKNGQDGKGTLGGGGGDDGSGEVDYKKSSGFAQHIKKKETDRPVSAFARTKSIRQQREYLPIFTVREELCNVIRENTAVVVVGETGSGKTTQ